MPGWMVSSEELSAGRGGGARDRHQGTEDTQTGHSEGSRGTRSSWLTAGGCRAAPSSELTTSPQGANLLVQSSPWHFGALILPSTPRIKPRPMSRACGVTAEAVSYAVYRSGETTPSSGTSQVTSPVRNPAQMLITDRANGHAAAAGLGQPLLPLGCST